MRTGQMNRNETQDHGEWAIAPSAHVRFRAGALHHHRWRANPPRPAGFTISDIFTSDGQYIDRTHLAFRQLGSSSSRKSLAPPDYQAAGIHALLIAHEPRNSDAADT